MAKFSFEDLTAYKKGRLLVREVYRLLESLPKEESFALGAQIRRASVSITANLAEGSGRLSLKEKLHYISVAYGSLAETFSELLTAYDLNYIQEQDIDNIRPAFTEMAKLLSGMRQSLLKRIELKQPNTNRITTNP